MLTVSDFLLDEKQHHVKTGETTLAQTESIYFVFLCGSVVEYCVSCAKGCGFDSQGTRTNENV